METHRYIDTFGLAVVGNTPLHEHVRTGRSGNIEIVNSLIAHGASLKARNKRGQTPASVLKDNDDISKEKKNKILKLLDIPVEILARGKSAIRSFQNELENGEIAVVNSRCMFLGKEGAGKTSCVKAMLGQRFKSNEPSTDGIAITTTLFQAIGKECDKWKKEDIDVMELNKKIREDALAEKLATQLIKEEMDDGEGSSDMSTSKSDSQLESSAISSVDPVKIGTSQKTHEHITAKMEKQTSTETKFHLQGAVSTYSISDFECSISSDSVSSVEENSRFKQTQRIFEEAVVEEITSKMKERTSFNELFLGEASTSDSRESDYTSLAVESAKSQLKENLTIPDSIQRKVVAKIKKRRQKDSWAMKLIRKFVKRRSDDSESIPSDVTTIWDYAGQLDYYITHRFFLTNRVSYCVAFNACDNLDEPANPRDSTTSTLGMTNLEMNMFWIRSIYEHTVKRHGPGSPIEIVGKIIQSPPICLVATHMDKLKKSKSKIWMKEVEDKFQLMFRTMEGMPYADHVDREMYMVDNTVKSHEGIKQLRRNVGRYMKDMVRTVPLKWLDLQERLHGIGKTRLCITFIEASGICIECGISTDGLLHALTYLNDIGAIMYSNTNKKLENTVITNIHIMIQMLTKVITVVKPTIKKKQLMQLWNKLSEKGILEEKLLRYLWQQEEGHIEVFIEVMKEFRLLFEMAGVEDSNRVFLVPCRMKVDKEPLEVTKDDNVQMVSIYLTPTDFLPDAVYHTLVVAFLELMTKADSDDPQVYRNRSDFNFKEHRVSLGAVNINNTQEKPYALKLEIYRLRIWSPTTDIDDTNIALTFKPELQPSVCMEVLSYLKKQLKTVCTIYEGIGYKLRVLCTVCDPNKHHLHNLKRCLNENSVKCGKNDAMDTAHIKRLFLPAEQITAVTEREREKTFETCISSTTEITRRSCVEPATLHYRGSSEEFEKIVVNVSSWYDEHGSLDKLKVLCKDLITPYNDLQNADCIDFFNLLKRSGNVTTTNVKVLIDAINVTSTNGVLEVNKLLKETFDKTNQCITSFSTYRQHLIQFGDALSKENTRDLIRLKSVLKKQSNNQWTVILDLEQRGILREDNLQSFIAFLKENNMTVPAEKLEYNA
ncbi:uncharacterized protein [Antedon mediterranea]|uniref:uncharacterized protein n=1 Tax=Antedon mediterranea TaxID=105859 RepID=UPI003AF6435A